MAAQAPSTLQSRLIITDSIGELVLMNIKDFFYWWYIQMPLLYLRSLKRISIMLDDQLSITLLLQTFFVPWKRDRKLMGRLMGIVMRLIFLPIAISIYFIVITLYVAFILFWILIPFATIILIIITPFINI